MLGISRPKPLYPDPYVDDGKVWCYYDITDISASSKLLGSYPSLLIAAMEVDGQAVTPTQNYQFSTTGEHLVKYTVLNNIIGSDMFRNIGTILKRVYMPDTVTSIAQAAFYQNNGVSFIRFSVNIIEIKANAVNGCNSLLVNDLSLPNLEILKAASFSGTRVKKVSNLGLITTLESDTFRNNSVLSDLILPATLTTTSKAVFYQTSLKRVVCYATTPPSLGALFFPSGLEYIKVPSASVAAYKVASGWSSYASIIQAIPE